MSKDRHASSSSEGGASGSDEVEVSSSSPALLLEEMAAMHVALVSPLDQSDETSEDNADGASPADDEDGANDADDEGGESDVGDEVGKGDIVDRGDYTHDVVHDVDDEGGKGGMDQGEGVDDTDDEGVKSDMDQGEGVDDTDHEGVKSDMDQGEGVDDTDHDGDGDLDGTAQFDNVDATPDSAKKSVLSRVFHPSRPGPRPRHRAELQYVRGLHHSEPSSHSSHSSPSCPTSPSSQTSPTSPSSQTSPSSPSSPRELFERSYAYYEEEEREAANVERGSVVEWLKVELESRRQHTLTCLSVAVSCLQIAEDPSTRPIEGDLKQHDSLVQMYAQGGQPPSGALLQGVPRSGEGSPGLGGLGVQLPSEHRSVSPIICRLPLRRKAPTTVRSLSRIVSTRFYEEGVHESLAEFIAALGEEFLVCLLRACSRHDSDSLTASPGPADAELHMTVAEQGRRDMEAQIKSDELLARHLQMPVKEPTSRREPVSEPTSRREPVKKPTSGGEPVKEPTSRSEPVKEPTSRGEPVKELTSRGDPVKEPTSRRDPVKDPTSRREPVKPTFGREPVKEPASRGEPVKEPTSRGEPLKEPASRGEPVKKPTSTGEAVKEPTSRGKPVKKPTSRPAGESVKGPVKEPTSRGDPVKEPTSRG
ncbi:uncharacterized protein LOC117647379 [Thrips palmi]|uniref:Uncharacterized protein LOC117647379 n=1 Tax=Thrips palmi TaxID=161013 RepID=A0A6P8ZQ01_THRPL|nr:uncharacterized protein LOC117647379 [Thrips palmi]